MKTPRNHTTLLLIAFFALTLPFVAFSQSTLMTNSNSIQNDAYEGIDGSPYYFENWQLGKVFDKHGKEIEGEEFLVNFNGYTKSMEVRKDNRFIVLDESFYSKVEIETNEGGVAQKTVFKTKAHPIYKTRFMKVVFEGTDFYVLEDYKVRLSNREKQGYAAKENIQQFAKNGNFYIVRGSKAKELRMKKKSFLKEFKDQQPALETFMKKNKLKLNQEKDLVQVLAYYEQLNHPKNPVAANKN